MDATVVDDIGLDYAIATSFEDFREAETEEIVADMAKVERFVGIGRRIFHHVKGGIIGGMRDAEIGSIFDMTKYRAPESRLDDDVEEPVDDIIAAHGRLIGNEPIADLLTHHSGRLACNFDPGEHNHREVAFKLLFGSFGHDRRSIDIDIIQLLESMRH